MTFKYLLFAVSIALTAPFSAQAQTQTQAVGQAVAAQPMTTGEVKKVDAEQGKVTIKHGPLTNLDMPAMTMVFRVADPGLLGSVKAGDNIRFVAEKVDGAFTVVQLEKAN